MYRAWPWNGHRLFGYDLVKYLEPKVIVELGTYWGNSFFTFCQAVKDFSLETKCHAIDTWLGDEHTGEYGDDVFNTVHSLCNTIYQDVNTKLMRTYFSEAVKAFENESIDLLHIDGLHTYEAVKEDYETWLPKLSKNGIILFHDISESCDYGSVRFWKETSCRYPSFTFQHSWGLGILFPKGDLFYHYMKENNFKDKQQIYKYKSELLLSRLQISDLEKFNMVQDGIIKKLEADQKRLSSSRIYKILRRVGLC